ncbi:MAG: hypothetical protein ACYSX1_12860 [Planctomycetota bacterium]|jgi:hypothetical protein
MENFIFVENDISQHIVRYGADIRPAITAKQEREKLQDYCNWLIENFPKAFETMLSGPDKTVVQKSFSTSSDKRVELPTFVMTRRGPLYTFPLRLLIEKAEDFDIPGRDEIFAAALDNFRKTFAGKIVRVGVVHEIIFDCGSINPVEIIAHAISKEVWREGTRNVRIHLEKPENSYNISIDLAPAYAQQVVRSTIGAKRKSVGFGISVRLDISNQRVMEDIDADTVVAIVSFAEDYVPDRLVKFLNNEPP